MLVGLPYQQRMLANFDLSGMSAVVLDDNPQMRAILSSILNGMQIRDVAEYSEPLPVLEHLQTRHVDVAILDLVLQGDIDGLRLSRAIRYDSKIVNPTVPIVMVTGYASMNVVDQAINNGVDELVTKPLRARDLMARVEKVVNRPHAYIQTPSNYFGPDRRRRDNPRFHGPDRRKRDMATSVNGVLPKNFDYSTMVPDHKIEKRMVEESVFELD